MVAFSFIFVHLTLLFLLYYLVNALLNFLIISFVLSTWVSRNACCCCVKFMVSSRNRFMFFCHYTWVDRDPYCVVFISTVFICFYHNKSYPNWYAVGSRVKFVHSFFLFSCFGTAFACKLVVVGTQCFVRHYVCSFGLNICLGDLVPLWFSGGNVSPQSTGVRVCINFH